MRGKTKAQVIIDDAKGRAENAAALVRRLRAEADAAQTVYEALMDMHDHLVRTLARKPRSTNGAGKSSVAAPSAGKKSLSKKRLGEVPSRIIVDDMVNVSSAADNETEHEHIT